MKAARKPAKRPPPKSPTQPRNKPPNHAVLVFALICVALVAYSNSFQTGFPFDNTLVLRDFRVQSATTENIGLIFSQEYWYNFQISGLYRPLTTFSYLVNYAILGNADHAAGYHWINFALHAGNIALVYALALLILQEVAPTFALAAIWSTHPVLTESVSNIVGRADLISAFGVLAGLLCHIKASTSTGRPRQAWWAALFLAAAIGAFSKESAVVLLPLMLLYDLTFRTASWRARAPGYVAAAMPYVIFFAIRAQVLSRQPAAHFPFVDNPIVGLDFFSGRATAIQVIGNYLRLLLWPSHLSNDYSYNQVHLVAWQAALALAVCIAAAAIAILCFRRRKPIFFFIAFFFLALAPTANIAITIGSIMAERFLYLPSIGFAACLVLAIYAASRRAHLAAPIALAVMALAFAARTFARNFDWQDNATLTASAIQSCPVSFKTHMLRATVLLRSEGVDAAIAEIEKSMAIVDNLPDDRNIDWVYINAATYYRQKGERLAAESNTWFHKSLDSLLRAQKIASYRTDPIDPALYQLDLELGRTYMRLNDPARAAQAFDSALEHGIGADLYAERSAAWRAAGDPKRAMLSYLEARVINANLPLSGLPEPHQPADVCTAYRNVALEYAKTRHQNWSDDTQRIAARQGCRP